jgi:hypothetical protein
LELSVSYILLPIPSEVHDFKFTPFFLTPVTDGTTVLAFWVCDVGFERTMALVTLFEALALPP